MPEVLLHKTKENKVCYLELNLPEKRNTLSLEMIQSLTANLETLSQDSNIHLLVLSGKGAHFCSGGDLRWMFPSPESSDLENINQVKLLSKMFYTLYNFPFPVIGKIKGSAFGGGLGLIALCDIVVAHKDSQFCFSEVKLGLVPALIAPFILEKTSSSKLRELMFSARIFKVEEAQNLDLIHFSSDTKECENYINKLIEKLLSYDKVALKQTKKLLNILPSLSKEEARDYTVQALAEMRKSPEVFKRINRFLKSRKIKNP